MIRRFMATFFLLVLSAVTSHAAPFIDNGNGTVIDQATGVIWQKSDDSTKRTWQQALDYCNDLTLDGNSNWRLPNIKELESIVDDTINSRPASAPVFSSKYSIPYKSASSYVDDPSSAWVVHFHDGLVYANSKNSNGYVRCVR